MNIQTVVENYYEAINNSSLKGIKNCMHDKNINKNRVVELYEPIFNKYKLFAEIISWHILGQDEKHVILKENTKTKRIEGAEFQDNITQNIHILEIDSSFDWKIVNSHLVGIEIL